ncbi:membrane protein [Mangrovimonas yunxiaonensis]|uniref:Membrane protein n=1 Tax=Mangrovimonas yunxiaonensis TaxID=1197477 RepID=A0A084TMM1_9FLAO|nr:hypothetical protein [Mangrovimonas yunxiaonensis]KFB01957.1 membrane protein [Mangrovimonas yunxiaonensis]GGH44969.1 hypothetical protein GCM10011364_18080 [Mangrovimonas yunxiaonensis]
MKPIKIITGILFLAAITSIVVGYIISNPKCIGFGVIGLFFLVFPLFSYYRWKDKDIKDYMITKENIEKMRKNQKRHKY